MTLLPAVALLRRPAGADPMIGYSDSITFDSHPGTTITPHPAEGALPATPSLLSWLLEHQVMRTEEWEELTVRDREWIAELTSVEEILAALTQRRLLTQFQADAVRKGSGNDLVLGQYRLVGVLGQGGMGTV